MEKKYSMIEGKLYTDIVTFKLNKMYKIITNKGNYNELLYCGYSFLDNDDRMVIFNDGNKNLGIVLSEINEVYELEKSNKNLVKSTPQKNIENSKIHIFPNKNVTANSENIVANDLPLIKKTLCTDIEVFIINLTYIIIINFNKYKVTYIGYEDSDDSNTVLFFLYKNNTIEVPLIKISDAYVYGSKKQPEARYLAVKRKHRFILDNFRKKCCNRIIDVYDNYISFGNAEALMFRHIISIKLENNCGHTKIIFNVGGGRLKSPFFIWFSKNDRLKAIRLYALCLKRMSEAR
jgi:hypothetical protein